jgi:hypothetical protein
MREAAKDVGSTGSAQDFNCQIWYIRDFGNSYAPFLAYCLRPWPHRGPVQTAAAEIDNANTSTRPVEGKWAKKEILGYLLDSASNNHQRFVCAFQKCLFVV